MKKILLCLFIMISISSVAQDCGKYYYLQNNKTIEMTIYDKKMQPNGKQIYNVSSVTTSGETTTGSINSELIDKNGKSIVKGNGSINCTGGIMMVDMKMLLPQPQQQQFSKADVQADNVYLEYPTNMAVGDALKDASITMNMRTNGMQQTVKMDFFNRKVGPKENITTPAGNWDCYKISYNAKINIKTMGIGIPVNFEGTEWFAPSFGIVKTQSKYGGTTINSIK